MNLNYFLVEKNISAYRLAKEADIPYSTIFDILHHKYDLNDCSFGTVMKICKVLNIRAEDLAKENKSNDFDLFKSNICQYLKNMSDESFILDTYKKRDITYYYSKGMIKECLYLLAMVDYLSRIHNLPLAKEYMRYRKLRLKETIYPKSVLAVYSVLGDKKILEKARKESIPEFIKFNIVEKEIRNVI